MRGLRFNTGASCDRGHRGCWGSAAIRGRWGNDLAPQL